MGTYRRWEKAAALALLLTIACCAWECHAGIQTQRDLAGKVVRLHVLANSDSESDQAQKLRVKDAVFARTEELLRAADDQQSAETMLQQALPELQALAERTLHRSGCTESVTVSLISEHFRTRYYDDFTLPAGEYRSLRVVIGEGAGRNWWCVVFPPLCSATTEQLTQTAAQAGLGEEEIALIREGEEGYRLRFRVLELWDRWMRLFE